MKTNTRRRIQVALIFLLLSGNLIADEALFTVKEPLEKLPECPPPIVIQEKSALPDWAWFVLGGLTGVAGVSFFYYNRQK